MTLANSCISTFDRRLAADARRELALTGGSGGVIQLIGNHEVPSRWCPARQLTADKVTNLQGNYASTNKLALKEFASGIKNRPMLRKNALAQRAMQRLRKCKLGLAVVELPTASVTEIFRSTGTSNRVLAWRSICYTNRSQVHGGANR